MSYRRRRNDLNHLMGFIVFLFAAGIFLLLSTTVFFGVENILVTGSSNYTAEEIISASGIKAGDNLVRTNTGKCEETIESRLVYIEKAEISRSFPSTIIINVEASVPVANFICDDYTLLISSGGKVLDKLSESKAGLLNFVGTSPSPDLIPGSHFLSSDENTDSAIKKLMEYFTEGKKDNITLIDVSDRTDLCYVYDGRITVKLGSASDIEYKMNFSREIIETKIGDRTEGVLSILADSAGASFLDKESLENNAAVYSENIAQRAKEEGSDTETESTEKRSSSMQME